MSQNMSKFVAFDGSTGHSVYSIHYWALCLLGIPGLCCHNRSPTSSRRDYKSQTLLAKENGVHSSRKVRPAISTVAEQTSNMTIWKVCEKLCLCAVCFTDANFNLCMCLPSGLVKSLWDIGAIERRLRERKKEHREERPESSIRPVTGKKLIPTTIVINKNKRCFHKSEHLEINVYK